MSAKETLWVAIPVSLLAISSLLSAVYMCISCYLIKLVQKRDGKNAINNNYDIGMSYWERYDLLTHHVFYMSLCDGILALFILISWLPRLWNEQYLILSTTTCFLGGLMEQFSIVGTLTWWQMISWSLFEIIFLAHSISLRRRYLCHSIFAWSITILCCIIPMFTDNYGVLYVQFQDKDFVEKECSISDNDYYLAQFIPITFAMVTSIFVLSCVVIKHYGLFCIKPERPVFDGISVKSYMVKRLASFTMMNILIWLIPLINRTYQIVHHQSIFWLYGMHHSMMAFNGTGNAILWSRSKNWKSPKQSFRELVNPDENSIMELRDNLIGL